MFASSTTIPLGLNHVEHRLFEVVMGMFGLIPGVLARVAQKFARGLVAMPCGLVGLVVVVTGTTDMATHCVVATLCSLASSPSVATICGGCRSISIVASDLMMAFCRCCRFVFFEKP